MQAPTFRGSYKAVPWWRWTTRSERVSLCKQSCSFSSRPRRVTAVAVGAFHTLAPPPTVCWVHLPLFLRFPPLLFVTCTGSCVWLCPEPLMDTGCFPVVLQKCPATGRLPTVSRPHVSFWMQSLIYSWFLLRFLLLKKAKMISSAMRRKTECSVL